MDFKDTPEEAAFREEARKWLKENVPTPQELEGKNFIEQAKLWQKRKYDAGWACITWPKEFGGRDASAIEQVIWNQEEAKYPDLPGGVFSIGHGGTAWADEETKVRAAARQRRGHLVSAVQRARRRVGPGGAAHPCREGR